MTILLLLLIEPCPPRRACVRTGNDHIRKPLSCCIECSSQIESWCLLLEKDLSKVFQNHGSCRCVDRDTFSHGPKRSVWDREELILRKINDLLLLSLQRKRVKCTQGNPSFLKFPRRSIPTDPLECSRLQRSNDQH